MSYIKNIYEATKDIEIEIVEYKTISETIENLIIKSENLIIVNSKLLTEILDTIEQTYLARREIGIEIIGRNDEIKKLIIQLENNKNNKERKNDLLEELKIKCFEFEELLTKRMIPIRFTDVELSNNYDYLIDLSLISSFIVGNLITLTPEEQPYRLDPRFTDEIKLSQRFYFYIKKYQSKLNNILFESMIEYKSLIEKDEINE